MTDARAPLIEIVGLTKQYQGLRPLRIARLAVGPGSQIALGGLDLAAAEAFVYLVTGAMLPDQGEVRVAGRSTREIATDTQWLTSLDRFGIVTERAVLLEAMTAAANLALPFTLSIDPMSDDVRRTIGALADEVGLTPPRLAAQVTTLSREERVRLHLGRALALDPLVLLLEHPTAHLDAQASEAIGTTLRRLSATRRLAWIALTEDESFVRAAAPTRLRLRPATGEVTVSR